jgi:hypothetical protein
VTGDGGLHERSAADDAFYEWLLSDRPGARVERNFRRGRYSARQERQPRTSPRGRPGSIPTRTGIRRRRGTWPPESARGPAKSATRTEVESAEPGGLYVAPAEQFETWMHVHLKHPDPHHRYSVT